MSLIKDVKTLLIENKYEEAIWLAYMPAPADDETLSLSIHATGGFIPNESSKIDEPTFQIYLRAKDYDTGYKTLLQAGDILCDLTDEIVDNNRYLSFYLQSDVADMGYADGFFKFALNFRCYVQRQKKQ